MGKEQSRGTYAVDAHARVLENRPTLSPHKPVKNSESGELSDTSHSQDPQDLPDHGKLLHPETTLYPDELRESRKAQGSGNPKGSGKPQKLAKSQEPEKLKEPGTLQNYTGPLHTEEAFWAEQERRKAKVQEVCRRHNLTGGNHTTGPLSLMVDLKGKVLYCNNYKVRTT